MFGNEKFFDRLGKSFGPPPHKSIKKWGILCNFRKTNFFWSWKIGFWEEEKIVFLNKFFFFPKPYFSRQKKIFFSKNYIISPTFVFCFFGGGAKTFSLVCFLPPKWKKKMFPKTFCKDSKRIPSFFLLFLHWGRIHVWNICVFTRKSFFFIWSIQGVS